MNRVLLIIPAYNEEAAIGKLLQELTDTGVRRLADLLVINDASDDLTGVIARQQDVTVIRNVFNMGYGSSLQLGYKYAVRRGYDYVIQMDADGQHDVSNVRRIYERLTRLDEDGVVPDIVIGSRFLEGSDSFRVSGMKRLAIGFFRRVIRRTAHQTILDPTSGLQGLSRKAVLYYAQFQNFNYSYPDANMLIQMIMLGFTVTEIPAVMHARVSGVSMHAGFWRPLLYMLTMPLSILSVFFRIKLGLQSTAHCISVPPQQRRSQ